MHLRRIWPAPCLLVLVLLAGCKQDSPDIPNVDGVKGVWASMFKPYGVYPLFPVRTNVQPGDVAILCKKHSATDSSPALAASGPQSPDGPTETEWVKLFSLVDADKLLAEYAATRMAYNTFAVTTSPAASAPMGPASGSGSPYAVSQVASTIGFASFPSVLSYTQRRSDFGVGTVAGVAALGGGVSAASQGYYTLEIPSVEYAELPFYELTVAVNRTVEAIKGNSAYADVIKSIGAAVLSEDCVNNSLSVVGTTFYTRHITVSMGNSSADALSARVAYQLPSDSTRDAVFKAIGSYATGASAPVAAGSSPLPASDPARTAQLMIDLDKVYKAADDNSKLGFTGVKVAFAKGSGSGVSMDYTYAVPVAFGIRLYPLRMDSGASSLQVVLGGSRLSNGTNYAGTYKQKVDMPAGFVPPAAAPAASAASAP